MFLQTFTGNPRFRLREVDFFLEGNKQSPDNTEIGD